MKMSLIHRIIVMSKISWVKGLSRTLRYRQHTQVEELHVFYSKPNEQLDRLTAALCKIDRLVNYEKPILWSICVILQWFLCFGVQITLLLAPHSTTGGTPISSLWCASADHDLSSQHFWHFLQGFTQLYIISDRKLPGDACRHRKKGACNARLRVILIWWGVLGSKQPLPKCSQSPLPLVSAQTPGYGTDMGPQASV